MVTDEFRASVFRHQWSRGGGMHWVYNTMRECVDTWRKWGIDGLPDWTKGAEALLAPDIQRDTDFHEMLRKKLEGAMT